MTEKTKLTYADAGVDIAEGAAAVEKTLALIEKNNA